MDNEEQIAEALKRMKILDLHPNVLHEFETEQKLNRSETSLGLLYWLTDDELEIVKEFKEKYNVLVYHVIKTCTVQMGTIYDLLFITTDQDEWEIEREDLKDGYALSHTIADFSESGMIKIEKVNGGVRRVY